MIRFLLIGLLAATLGACAYPDYKFVGKFDDGNELLTGKLDDFNSMRGRAWFSASTADGAVRCDGEAFMTYEPAFCPSRRGIALLQCTDGRRIRGNWKGASWDCMRREGYGYDQYGNRFTFAFGLLTQDAEAYAQRLAGSASTAGSHRQGASTGTGFFVTRDGVLVTNFHVIDDATRISVALNGRQLPATVLVSDAANDLALLKIDAATRPIPIGMAAEAVRGEDILTLGYPVPELQGQEQKATFGRINALSGLQGDIRYLQVDLPVQPGNSGGPLLNRRGQVIGIITATLDGIETYRVTGSLPQAVNYAVKADYLLPMLRSVANRQWIEGSRNDTARALSAIAAEREASVVLIIAE